MLWLLHIVILCLINYADTQAGKFNRTSSVCLNKMEKKKCWIWPSVKLNDKEVIPTESLTHLGIDRYANDPSPDASIDDRLCLGRRSAYALMGSGFHGMNGISPAISIHIYRTYVLPRVLYGLEGTIRKSRHITKLERFHRKTFKAATDVTRSYGYMCSVSARWYTTPGGLFGRPDSYLALHGWSRHGLVPSSHGALPVVR